MNWLLARIAHWLLGPGLSDRDHLLDGLTLAIQEEAERMGIKPCQHFFVRIGQGYTGRTVQCEHCGLVRRDTLPSPA